MGKLIDVAQLREDLIYEPETGLFRWRHGVATGNGALRLKPGQTAGTNTSDGYRQIRWQGRIYRAHRLAWVYTYGRWPEGDIDHINCEPSDNRLANLREATRAQNLANTRRRRTNKSGYKGTTWSPHANRWSAWIGESGKTRHLGYFDSREEAHEAYIAAAKDTYGKFARAA